MNTMELDYQDAIDEFWMNRRCYLHSCIRTDSPNFKKDMDAFTDKVYSLNLPDKQAGDLEDGAANMVGDAIQYAHRNGFQDGIKFILQNLKAE